MIRSADVNNNNVDIESGCGKEYLNAMFAPVKTNIKDINVAKIFANIISLLNR